MISEMEIQTRMTQIINEYSSCKEFDDYSLSLEPYGENGDIQVLIQKDKITFERIIEFKEDLGWISDTFSYPPTITPNSKDFALNCIKRAYFNEFGDLMVEHTDSTIEKFKVRSDHKDRVVANLKNKLGKLFKG
jgi:hypothetical protein